MDKYEKLKEKYSGKSVSTKKQFNIRNFNRDGMHKNEKPKNAFSTIARVLKFLGKQKVILLISIILAIANTVLSLLCAYRIRPIINNYINVNIQGDIQPYILSLRKELQILAILYILTFITTFLVKRLMLYVSQKALSNLRKDLNRKVLLLPISFYDRNTVGDLMSRFTNDVDSLAEVLNTTLIQMFTGLFTIVGTVILMMYTNWILGLITIISAPILTFISRFIIKKSRPAYKKNQKNLGILNGYTEEMLNGAKELKVFSHEASSVDEFDYINNELCNSSIESKFKSSIMGPITHQLCNVIYAVTATVGAILCITSGFDIGGLTISLNYTRQFNRPINEMSMQLNTIFSALAGAERVFAVLDCAEEVDYEDAKDYEIINGDVEIKNVSFGYLENKIVLHNINLHAKKGMKVAFVGSTGAGKTTITNLINRFYEINDGDVLIDGNSIKTYKLDFLRKNVAMVLQDTHLFTGTIMENIRYGRIDATDDEVIDAAKKAQANNFILNLEKGYNTFITNDGANLSQGERQLINISRAILSHAPILVLDEATSSVDTKTERLIEKGIENLMSNRTTFIIAHRLSTVKNADIIMVLENGRIIERGNDYELLEMKGRYYDLSVGNLELD